MKTILGLVLLAVICEVRSLNSVWGWTCEDNQCQKTLITDNTTDTALSLAACRLVCSEVASLWPKPTGTVIASNLTQISWENFTISPVDSNASCYKLVEAASAVFKDQVNRLVLSEDYNKTGKTVTVTLTIQDTNTVKLGVNTNESYTLKIAEGTGDNLEVTIEGLNFFGVRHGLETLSQLVIYDDLRDEVLLPSNVSIVDGPAFKWRGVLLDTARNYIDIASINRTIDAMGATKLNTFHWHITDSSSFPWVSKSRPELSKYGAYIPSKVYTSTDIASIIWYGKVRGVRVIPEFDAPAHVGEGWQNTDFVTCFNWQPWTSYCNEPPCGQFDPTKEGLYDALEDIYGDLLEQFEPEVFHMGGDEVSVNCWNSTDSITTWMTEKGWGRTTEDFVNLWNYFQSNALERLYNKSGTEIPVILWTSDLTQQTNVTTNLPNDKYIIQVWTTADDTQISTLLSQNYSLIISNYDALYLDCGFASWVSTGQNWCSPYKGWHQIYENRMDAIAGDRKSQILGAEVALWTEQADSMSVDSRLWPRASALAEVLWTEPETSWKEAEPRILIHRERLVNMGINADALEPEWCLQHQGNCPEPSDGSSINSAFSIHKGFQLLKNWLG